MSLGYFLDIHNESENAYPFNNLPAQKKVRTKSESTKYE